MLRLEVVFTAEALADLQSIYSAVLHISQSHMTATRFTRRLAARCRRIGLAPLGGRPRNDLRQGLCTVPFERTAVITYSVSDRVEIINIFYGGRDYEALYHRGETGKAEGPK